MQPVRGATVINFNADAPRCRYFTVKRLPRYVGGQREYEVELQYTSGLLGPPCLESRGTTVGLTIYYAGFPERPVEGSQNQLAATELPALPTSFNTTSNMLNP